MMMPRHPPPFRWSEEAFLKLQVWWSQKSKLPKLWTFSSMYLIWCKHQVRFMSFHAPHGPNEPIRRGAEHCDPDTDSPRQGNIRNSNDTSDLQARSTFIVISFHAKTSINPEYNQTRNLLPLQCAIPAEYTSKFMVENKFTGHWWPMKPYSQSAQHSKFSSNPWHKSIHSDRKHFWKSYIQQPEKMSRVNFECSNHELDYHSLLLPASQLKSIATSGIIVIPHIMPERLVVLTVAKCNYNNTNAHSNW